MRVLARGIQAGQLMRRGPKLEDRERQDRPVAVQHRGHALVSLLNSLGSSLEYSLPWSSAPHRTRFPRLHLLPANTQVRTLTSPLTTTPASSSPTTFPALFSHIVSWTILEYEDFLSSQEDAPRAPRSPPSVAPNLTRTSLSTTLFSLLSILELISSSAIPTNAARGSAVLLGGKIRVERRDVALGGGRAKVALVDALGRLVGREWRMDAERNIGDAVADAVQANGAEGRLRKDDRRWEQEVEERIKAVEAALASGVGRSADDWDEKVAGLGERVDEVERRQRKADRTPRARIEELMEAPTEEPWRVGKVNVALVGIIAVLVVPYVRPFL